MVILDLLPSNTVDVRRASASRGAAFMPKGLFSLYEEMSKLSTKDLLALASMKNVAKREM
jgi:hypothetical protein